MLWPKSRPPTDKPACGFNNERCRWLSSDVTLLTLLVTFPLVGLLALLGIGVLVWQKVGLQSRLDHSYWWLISYSDITIVRESPVRSAWRSPSKCMSPPRRSPLPERSPSLSPPP